MRSGDDPDNIRIMSTFIARELLKDIAPEKARYCDVIIEEYYEAPETSPKQKIDRRHGFVSFESYLLVELPAAIICGLIVEVVKYYFIEVRSKFARKDKSEHIDLLTKKFTDEALKNGLSELQAKELTQKFSEILLENPTIISSNP